MKEIHTEKITEAIKNLTQETNFNIPDDVRNKIIDYREKESSALAKGILTDILKNHEKSREKNLPLCQDTGLPVLFLELGQNVKIIGEDLGTAINKGIKQGYEEGYLRKSIVQPPIFARKNTEDNTPAIIHTNIVEGDKFKIFFAPKGGGAENMSYTKMMKPADGKEGVKNFVVDSVKKSGGNPCPPVVVGVGVGGNFEKSALLAKKSLFRNLYKENPSDKLNNLEQEILQEINNLDIGPQGLGGDTTALGVHIETAPCHIASLPVAVNLQCHCHRHKIVEVV